MLPHASHALCFHEPKKAPCSANRQKAARDPLSNRTTGTQREDYIQMPIVAPRAARCALACLQTALGVSLADAHVWKNGLPFPAEIFFHCRQSDANVGQSATLPDQIADNHSDQFASR